MACKLGIPKGVCEDKGLTCKFYKGQLASEPCELYEMLNHHYMKDREISVFNIWLEGVLRKN